MITSLKAFLPIAALLLLPLTQNCAVEADSFECGDSCDETSQGSYYGIRIKSIQLEESGELVWGDDGDMTGSIIISHPNYAQRRNSIPVFTPDIGEFGLPDAVDTPLGDAANLVWIPLSDKGSLDFTFTLMDVDHVQTGRDGLEGAAQTEAVISITPNDFKPTATAGEEVSEVTANLAPGDSAVIEIIKVTVDSGLSFRRVENQKINELASIEYSLRFDNETRWVSNDILEDLVASVEINKTTMLAFRNDILRIGNAPSCEIVAELHNKHVSFLSRRSLEMDDNHVEALANHEDYLIQDHEICLVSE